MEHTPAGIIEFRLAPAELRVSVDVRLRRAQERWVATATIRGERQVGLGSSPRQALKAALAALDTRAVTALLADTALLEPSVTIARISAG
jgi:hypothetical protein